MSPEGPFRRIDEHSPEYQAPSHEIEPVQVFGADSLAQADTVIDIPGKELGTLDDGGFEFPTFGDPEPVGASRETQIERLMYVSRQTVLTELQNNPETMLKALELFAPNDSDARAAEAMFGAMDTEEYAAFLENYTDAIEPIVERAAEMLSELEADFRETVGRAIDEGRLPISRETMERRLAEAPVRFFDTIGLATRTDGDFPLQGQFHREDRYLEIHAVVSPEQLRHTYFHEQLHNLSGRTIGAGRSGRQHEQRVGLAFIPVESEGRAHKRRLDGPRPQRNPRQPSQSDWLNEAVTEDITLELLGEDEGFYPEEREALELVLTAGAVPVDRELLRAAYFENYEAGLPSDERIPAWKALTKRMAEAHGPRAIQRWSAISNRSGTPGLLRSLRD